MLTVHYKRCNYYINYLIKAKKVETINILIDEKKYKDLTIFSTTYDCEKLITMLILHYHELMGKKIKNVKGKNI